MVSISKETFVRIINFIQQQEQLENNLCSAMEEMTDGCYVDFYVFSKYQTEMLLLLQEVLHDKSDYIGYWCYELEFGKKYTPGCISDKDGTAIDISTAEKLYDLLVKEF